MSLARLKFLFKYFLFFSKKCPYNITWDYYLLKDDFLNMCPHCEVAIRQVAPGYHEKQVWHLIVKHFDTFYGKYFICGL